MTPIIFFKLFLWFIMFLGAFLLVTDVYGNVIRKKRKLALADNNDGNDSSIHSKDGVPILPRHLRSVENTVNDDTTPPADTKKSDTNNQTTTKPITPTNIKDDDEDEATHPVITDLPLFNKTTEEEEKEKISLAHAQEEMIITQEILEQSTETQTNQENSEYYILEEQEKSQLDELENENLVHSPLLQQYLSENYEPTDTQHRPLMNASDNLNISIVLENEDEFITGEKLLELIEKYGFKFGAMNMFHRYQNKDGTGLLWFSMLGLTEDSIVPFDLNILPEIDDLTGLVIFLPLPHPKVLQGFDSMMSIANLIAREVGGYIVDEYGDEITVEYRKELRNVLKTTLVDE